MATNYYAPDAKAQTTASGAYATNTNYHPVTQSVSPALTAKYATTNSSSGTPATTTTSPSSTSSSSSSDSSSNDKMDRDANPGEGWFYDAADGWKQAEDKAAAEAKAREDALRGTINSQWDSVFGYLDQVDGRLPGQRDEQSTQINNLATSSTGKLDTAKTYANDQISANQKTTLSKLADDLRAALQAGNTYLGQRGASDSSATERYSTALMKSANKQRGEVMMQSDAQRAQVQNTYDTQIAQLGEWTNTKVYELGQWYNDAKNQLDYQRSQASGQKAQALAQLDAQLHQYALDRLRSIEDQASNWKTSVNAWMMEQNGAVSSAVNKMGEMPMAPTYSGLASASSSGSADSSGNGAGYTNTGEDEPKYSLLNGQVSSYLPSQR